MLRHRYEPMNLFALVSALSLALDPVLTQLDRVLDDDVLFQAVKADLIRRFPRTPIDGRPSTPVEVILRMLVVKHLYEWSYEATERWVGDSLVLRQFCRVYAAPVPDDTTLLRWANLIQPATLHRLLDHVVVLARALKVTHGRKLRIDGTVVETHIHHPTDSTLLYDGVRVLSRTLGKAKQVFQTTCALAHHVFRDRTRSAKRQMKPSLDHHLQVFKRPPHLLVGDRGIHSTANERYATTHGVTQVVLPKPGAKSAKRLAHEQQRWFRRGHNWRSGIEGRISGLKRRHKLDRCRYRGTVGMERWGGWGVIVHDLRVITQAIAH